jgi:hypothetical protein
MNKELTLMLKLFLEEDEQVQLMLIKMIKDEMKDKFRQFILEDIEYFKD